MIQRKRKSTASERMRAAAGDGGGQMNSDRTCTSENKLQKDPKALPGESSLFNINMERFWMVANIINTLRS